MNGNGDLNFAQGAQLPLLNLQLNAVPIKVAKDGQGQTVLVIGPLALQLLLPLDSAAAKKIGGLLVAGIEIPTIIPPPED